MYIPIIYAKFKKIGIRCDARCWFCLLGIGHWTRDGQRIVGVFSYIYNSGSSRLSCPT